MILENTSGVDGLHLASAQWLEAHHGAKVSERREMAAFYGIKPGDRILDLGCGPGYWTPFFAESGGVASRITGLDLDPSHIALAIERNRALVDRGIASFHVRDITELPYDNDQFDIVICGNTYNYFENIDDVIAEHLRVLKPGGRLAVRTFDNTATIFHPMPTPVLLSILLGASRALAENPPARYFDNYLGKKMHGILTRNPVIRGLNSKTFLTEKYSPADNHTTQYICMKGQWYGDLASDWCDAETIATWRQAFDPNSTHFIADSPDLYFSTVEMVTIATKCV